MSQKLPGITFWLFLLCFGQILKKTPVPDNFQLTIYKLKLPGTSYILKVQPLPGNSMLTYSKLGIARNLLHFLEIVRNHFHFWRQFLAIPSTYVISVLIFKAFGLLYYWFKCLMSSYIRKWGVWGHTFIWVGQYKGMG